MAPHNTGMPSQNLRRRSSPVETGREMDYAYLLRFECSLNHKYTIEITVRKRDIEVRYGKARYRHGIALSMRESVTVSCVEWARRFELAVSLVGYAISTRYRVSTERERHVVPIWEQQLEWCYRSRLLAARERDRYRV
uniref:Uncharacterized protein n=1 Tax=Oryza nivara TaxID=4536 RepID=A0A0E0GT80_ORYNI